MSKERRLDDGARDGRKWSLVLLCLLAQNCVMGFAFGSFGPLLASTEQDFGVSRALATAGMSLITLALGGLSPVLGGWMERVSVRTGMAGGALLSAIGYVGLACAGSFAVALGMYGLIGIGVCLTAILGPLILISRWFDKNRGKVLSIVNLPILLFLTPYIVAKLLPHYGRAGLLSAMGAICALLALLLLRLVEPAPVAAQQAQPGVPAAQCASGASLLKRPAFWLLSLGIGIMAGAGTGFVVHIVPFGMSRQMPFASRRSTAVGLCRRGDWGHAAVWLDLRPHRRAGSTGAQCLSPGRAVVGTPAGRRHSLVCAGGAARHLRGAARDAARRSDQPDVRHRECEPCDGIQLFHQAAFHPGIRAGAWSDFRPRRPLRLGLPCDGQPADRGGRLPLLLVADPAPAEVAASRACNSLKACVSQSQLPCNRTSNGRNHANQPGSGQKQGNPSHKVRETHF